MNEYVAGSTSVVDLVFLQDSTSTTGAGKTGLVYNTASLTCYYKRSNGTASVAVSLATITTLGTFASGGFKEIDAANMPGCYEFHPPDAAFASGAKEVTFFFTGATGLVPRPIKYRIMLVNPDATGGKVPATLAAADVTGNVPADLQTIKTQAVTCAAGVTVPTSLASPTNITAGTISTVTTLTNLPAITAGWLTATGIATSALNGKGDWLLSSGYTAPPSAATIATTVRDVDNTSPAVGSLGAKVNTSIGDSSGVGTLLSRIGGSITIAGGKVAATVATGDDADAASVKVTIGVAGAGLSAVPYTGPSTVTLAASQPSYAPAKAGDAMTLAAGERNTLVDLVWDEPKSGHTTPDTYGVYLDSSISGVSTGGISADDIAMAVWANTTRTLTAFGFTVATTANGDIIAIRAKTDLIPDSPAAVGSAMTLTLTQPITDVQTATVGGALAGGWALAWGRAAVDRVSKLLKLWGPGNATGTASATFDLDDGDTPTTRTPQ